MCMLVGVHSVTENDFTKRDLLNIIISIYIAFV